ncbi:MAG TPA: tripartite tricarboxylate transporter substrate binding protein [Anaeromyxobacteraceae bacterium]|nr:tripartite tricarboxylate transporter substrate binding protein [Anaeromyxobacteraceae bacterium]
MNPRRLAGIALGLASALAAGRASAGGYPDKPVQYIIPFSAGGESDVAARLQAQLFSTKFKQEMIVVNKPGAGGALAWSQLNGMPGDGYTIMGTNVPHIILQPLEPNTPYKTEDITPVYFFHFTPDAIVVAAESPFKTYADLVKFAKENPGKVTFAGSAQFSANHMAHERFKRQAGVNTTYVPFKGTGDLIASLLGQHVTAAMTYSTLAVQQGPKVRLLAIATEKRSPLFPDAPTFKEVGLGWAGGAYRGIAVPKSTPAKVQKQVSDMMAALNKDPDYVKRMTEGGFEQVDIPLDKIPAFMKEQTKATLEDAKLAGMVQ